MNKKFVFYTLILTVFINSFNGFSRNAKTPNPPSSTRITNTYNASLSTYISLISDFQNTDQIYAIFRSITLCPGPSISVNVDPGTCGAVVNSILPTTDIVGGSMVLITPLGDGDTFPVGTTSVTYEERDAGNTSTVNTCSFDVTVVDNEAPTPDAATLLDVTAQCEVTSLTAPTATDNCGGAILVTNNATLPITAQGTTVVVWTYEDVNGLTSTQNQNVIITDTTAPTPDTATLSDVTAQCEVISLTAPTATDNCGGTIIVTNNATLPITAQGTTVVVWTYEDVNG
ncbi:MAG: HYR domain-containing protein, partial [Oceanihabitans sp.]|nr:HYR domain-containing protein [Oceanihabitans sp.]